MSTSVVRITIRNRYRMVSEFGRVGMSAVCCANDTDLERRIRENEGWGGERRSLRDR